MSDRLQRLAEDRALRNAARENFYSGWRSVTGDLEKRGIGQRVSDRALQEVRELADKTLAVAGESKGIIAGTVAAIMLWLFRGPIITWAEGLFADDDADDETSENSVQPSDSDVAE
jgi:hypothetical protein